MEMAMEKGILFFCRTLFFFIFTKFAIQIETCVFKKL